MKGRKRTITVIAILMITMLILTVSAGLISFYARIDVSINASPAILVDGRESPQIKDTLDLIVGETKNVTHSVSNLNANYTYQLGFQIVDCDEGLNISFWIDSIETTTISIDSNSTKEFAISYFVLPNAESGKFKAMIEIVFIEAHE